MRSGCFIHILIIYYFFSVVQYPAEIDKKNFRETVSPHFALKGTIRLNKRNSNIPSRERKDSVTETERRGMQQGFPVRKDADRSIDPPVNRPDGPREVPLSLREGKIPVREDAATGRTFPVLNRFGKKPDAVPVTEEPVAEPTTQPTTVPSDVPQEEGGASQIVVRLEIMIAGCAGCAVVGAAVGMGGVLLIKKRKNAKA